MAGQEEGGPEKKEADQYRYLSIKNGRVARCVVDPDQGTGDESGFELFHK